MKAPRKLQRAPNILEAMSHPHIFGQWFSGPSWDAWRAWLSAIFALPMTQEQLALYSGCTGRAEAPTGQMREAWLLCGRRAGKSKVLAMLALYSAFFIDWKPYLTVGETGVVAIVAADRAQAKVIFNYILGMLREVPAFKKKLVKEKAEEIELENGLVISINTANFRTIRGRTVVLFLGDEICFWRNDETAANPAEEVLAAVRPAQATVPGALLICASSPYAKSGAAWETAKRYFGDPGRVLVWQNAPSKLMNPTIPQEFIDAELERDPVAGRSEYLGEWRDDISGFCTREMVMGCTVRDRIELPYDPGRNYLGFCDPSGGISDSMVGSVGYERNGFAVVAAVMEIMAPFDPGQATAQLAAFFKCYHVQRIEGDKYGGDWPSSRFAEHGITYTPAERSKGDLYREFLPLLTGRKVELLDLPRLQAQLCSLERRVTRGNNKEVIDHPAGGQFHDDVCNCVSGLCVGLASVDDALAVWLKLGQQAAEEERVAAMRNTVLVRQIADERAAKTAQAGFWDVAARKFHHGEPPAGTVRCLVRGEFGLRLSTYGQPVKFQAGLNDVPAELLEHSWMVNQQNAGNVTVIKQETK